MSKELRWVSIGCGVIAHQLAEALAAHGRTLYGVANRTYQKAVDFAAQYHIQMVYPSIDDVFDDPKVDVIYLSTPHNTHLPLLLKALQSGKHVLCEKAITLNSDELTQAVRAADEHGVKLGEAMTIFHMPIYTALRELVRQGRFGALRLMQLNFGSFKDYDMKNRFFNRSLAGGALLDIGVYALSLARWFFSEQPTQILSQIKRAPTGVDEQAGILLMNERQEMASIILSLHAKQPKRATLSFEKGYLEIFEYPRADKAVFTDAVSGKREEFSFGAAAEALWYEVRDMERSVAGEDVLCLDLTRDVMEIMTAVRREHGLTYPEEEKVPEKPNFFDFLSKTS